jgi:hypothetical protein
MIQYVSSGKLAEFTVIRMPGFNPLVELNVSASAETTFAVNVTVLDSGRAIPPVPAE